MAGQDVIRGWFRRGIGGMACTTLVLGLMTGCDRSASAPAAVPAANAAAPAAPVQAVPEKPAIHAEPLRPGEPAPPAVDAPVLPIAAVPASFELGFVNGNEIKTVTVQLRNLSDKPMTIKKVQPNCTCTTLGDYRGKVIQPGESIPVTARYEAPEDTGPKSAKVWVFLEGFPDESYLTIPVNAEVALAIRATPGYLKGDETAKGFGEIHLESIDKAPFRILATDGQEPVYLDGFKPGDTPKNSYVVKWDLRDRFNTCVNIPWWWVVETDHPRCPVLDVRIRHQCTSVSGVTVGGRRVFVVPKDQWRISSLRALVGVVEPGKAGRVRFAAENIGMLNLVSGVPLMGPIKSVEVVSSEWKEGIKYFDVDVTTSPDHRGLFFGVVEFTANDGTTSPVWLIGTVREMTPRP